MGRLLERRDHSTARPAAGSVLSGILARAIGGDEVATIRNPIRTVIFQAGDTGDDAAVERRGAHGMMAVSATAGESGLGDILIHGWKFSAFGRRKEFGTYMASPLPPMI